MNNLDEDIQILKEKLKILNDTKLKKTDQLERELQAIENVLSELETYKKIAEKLAEYIAEKSNFCANKCCMNEECHDNDCIIDWARNEVEKDE